MARDEEFRKVAEDLRALGRSLARDFWNAADQARRSGRPPGHMISHGLRQMADEARRGLRGNDYYRGGRPSHHRWSPPPGPGAPGTPPGPRPVPGYGGWGRPAPPRWNRPRPQRRPAPPPVRRRWDSTTVLGVLILLFGSTWLLGALHAVRVPVEGVVAVGLVLLGLAAIITARTDWSMSRHAWPVWLGAGLLIVLVATSSTFGITGTLDNVSFGNMSRTASSGQTVHGGFGNLAVDATALSPGATVKVETAAGRTTIAVPAGVPFDLHARVLAGQVCVQGLAVAQGLGADIDRTFSTGPAVAPVQIDVHQLAGEVVVDGPGCSR